MKNQNSILVSGASSGIGKACANRLAKNGFKVYAGVLNAEELKDFQNDHPENLVPLILDVTNQKHITAATELIAKQDGENFFGLVNNAGIPVSGVVEAVSVEDFRRLFEINVIGMHALCHATLPWLRKNKGRIVIMGSLSGFMVAPGSSTYSASKFALKAYTQSLRMEVKDFGMHVSMIAPGAIDTNIWKRSTEYRKKLRKNANPQLLKDYDMFLKAADKMEEGIHPIPPDMVAQKVEHALTSDKPKRTYLVGKDAKQGYIFSLLPLAFQEKFILKQISKFKQK